MHVENLNFQDIENSGIFIVVLHLMSFHPLASICVNLFNTLGCISIHTHKAELF